MTVHQISIFLENKYGTMSVILDLLASENIRIIAATVADTMEFGIMRMIVSDPQKAYTLLKEHNVSVHLTDVLAIKTDSQAGSFARVLGCFTQAGLTIEYMYCFSITAIPSLCYGPITGKGAREVIRRRGLEYICESDLVKL